MRYGHNKWKADAFIFVISGFFLLLIISIPSGFQDDALFFQISRLEALIFCIVFSVVVFLTYMKNGEDFDIQLTHDKLIGASSYYWMSKRHEIDLTKRFKIKSKRIWFLRADSFYVIQGSKRIYFSSMGLGVDNVKDLRNRLLSYSFGA